MSELRALEGDVSQDIANADLASALDGHDAVHVVFGCDITDRDEILAHFWMLFGTDLTMADMKRANEVGEHMEYARKVHRDHKPWMLLVLLPKAFRIFLRSLRMTKKWPFKDYQALLDRELGSLRREFGISPL